jgi:hypothetical protein
MLLARAMAYMQASFICAALLLSIPCRAYAQTQAEKPAFDVASIKPNNSPPGGRGAGRRERALY